MARGNAVVATRVGAVERVVNNQCGWLIDPADADQLTALLKKILDSDRKDILDKKLAAFSNVQENFKWDIIANEIIDAISKAVN